MFRVFACLGGAFEFVRATPSPAVALRYATADTYLVCDPGGGCYDMDELQRLARAAQMTPRMPVRPTGRLCCLQSSVKAGRHAGGSARAEVCPRA
jgi:hypothetical protein